MAHFAELDENDIVIDVIKVNNEDLLDENNLEKESIGIAFLKGLFGESRNYVQTSYNNNFRKYYAIIGGKYYREHDVFLPPKPFPSWSFSETEKDWVAPIWPPPPLDDIYLQVRYWDEKNQIWHIIHADQYFPSWQLNETTGRYEAPVPIPDDYEEKYYEWNEDELSWYHVYWVDGQRFSIKV